MNLPDDNIDGELINKSYIVNRTVCSIPTEDCFNCRCGDCSKISPSDIVLHNIEIYNDENLSWSQWTSVKNKIDLLCINGSISSLLNEFDSQWDKFLLHWFITKQQKEYIRSLRLNSSETEYIVAQLDFAENFTIFHQREVQGHHWNNQQVTLFTVHLKIGSISKNIVIFSDYMLHNTNFVYVTQQLIVNFIKQYFPSATRINYLKLVFY